MVEDDAGDRWYFSELLRARGYDVVSADSGEAAWKAFAREPVPLVFLDLMLPGMDGGELCRKIRDLPGGWEPVIVAVTGHDDPGIMADILEAGADDFIRKPVEPQLLSVRMAIAERRVHDRARRQGAETQLETKAWELRRLFRNLPDVFFSVDLTEGRLIQISPSAEVLFGRGTRELMEDPDLWREVILPEAFGDRSAKHEAGGRLTGEYLVTRPDGSTTWARVSCTVDRDPGTAHLRADGTAVDTGEEHRARTELGERNRELGALYAVSELTLTAASPDEAYGRILEEVAEVMSVPVVLLEQLDRAQDRLVVTAARGLELPQDAPLEIPVHQTPSGAAVQTGRPALIHDARGRRDLVHDSLRALEPRAWASFPLTSGGAVAGTLTLVHRAPVEMGERWVHMGMSLAATIAAFMERLEAEEALRESESRHRALAAQLQQANQELESFAYSVSHDLRAPLRTMQGFAHAMLQNYGDALPGEARDYARRIIASGRQSERLITDLLAYSRLSFEKLDVKAVDLDTVLAQALEQVQADMDESRARVDVPRKLPTVLGNQTALVQVVANLLSNGVKFVARDRRPEVRVRTEERGEMVRLWVEDNGIGIPDGQEERIFRVFERLTEGGDHQGTGIGLAIVRRGMQRIGGACGVEHLPGGGSAFWIEALKERRKTRRPWTRRSRGF